MREQSLLWATAASVAFACSPATPDHTGEPVEIGSSGGVAGASSMSTGGTSGAVASGGQPDVGGTSASGGAMPSGGAPAGGTAGCVENLACTLPAPASTGDMYQDCVDRINQFRTQCACLPPLERWTDGEACANQMAEYDSTAPMAHAGFQAKICTGGSAQDECPGWRSTEQVVTGCLQKMWDEGPPPQTPCTDACYQDHGHFINMTNTRMTKVACGFFTTPAGKVWSVQNFSR